MKKARFIRMRTASLAGLLLAGLDAGPSLVNAADSPSQPPAWGYRVREEKGELVFRISFALPAGTHPEREEELISATSQTEFLRAVASYADTGPNGSLSIRGAYRTAQRVDRTKDLCTVDWRVPKDGFKAVTDNRPADKVGGFAARRTQKQGAPRANDWRYSIKDYVACLERLRGKVSASLGVISARAGPGYDTAVDSLGAWATGEIDEMAAEAAGNPRLLGEERRRISDLIRDAGNQMNTQIEEAFCRYE
jgi:hypothetical protein